MFRTLYALQPAAHKNLLEVKAVQTVRLITRFDDWSCLSKLVVCAPPKRISIKALLNVFYVIIAAGPWPDSEQQNN